MTPDADLAEAHRQMGLLLAFHLGREMKSPWNEASSEIGLRTCLSSKAPRPPVGALSCESVRHAVALAGGHELDSGPYSRPASVASS